ncbi:uncharacterized protein [Branchiostoma lanceolatum]|uniref:uncharacterized protein n=1 Tax=Branchiostoma lanceolatum TaxID=7740 RepID=UPI003454538F
MRLLLYTFLCSAVVSFGRSQATWNRGVVPEATAQINVLASVFMSQPGYLQQKHTVFSAMNWTDIPPPQPTGNISQQCQKDVAQYEADLFQGKRYALKMLDASGKPASGIMDWNWEWFGRYTECVKITRGVFNIPFDGKFYMTRLEQVRQGEGILADVYELTVGMCVPSSCGQHDVIHQLDGSVYWRFVVQQGIFKVTSAYSEESLPIQNVTIAAICICSVLLLLIAIGTIYDVVIQHLRRVAIKRQKDAEEQEADVTVSVPGDIALVSVSNPREETPTAATTGEGKEVD